MADQRAPAGTKRDRATAQRRGRILDAAVMCFLENGYHQTGVRDIAKRAGVSLGNLYNHFAGKHDILAEIATLERTELAPVLALLARTDPAPAVLDGFVTAYATYLAKPENVILTIEITSEAIRKPDIGDLFVANRAELVDALAAVLTRGIADRHFRAMPDPRDTAHLIIELIEGTAYRSVLSGLAMGKLLSGLKDFIMAAVREG
ncbi:MAG: TetR/AcrR family transcriptional regulator [Roseitalea sp.]|nr:TetR/AcrR family transcriptional regulator [Roseitalea sp.]MBO6721622.1 TetR/AcrR family transcriptional regulator [Roseitalea sp.]MBO6743378.1 TetR/AcrR family transcriptional regulator [Roseitalea sp.]